MTISATSIGLSWTSPATGAAPGYGYTVLSRVTGNGAFAIVAAGLTGTSYEVSGLVPTTSYDFAVFGVSTAGPGPMSAIITQATLGDVPNAPAGLTASAGSPAYSVIDLSWTAPATDSTHGPAASYIVQQSPHGAGTWTTVQSGVTGASTSVTGLAHDTALDFQVLGVNSAGTGTASGTATLTTDYAPPNAPAGLAVVPVDDGSATKLTATWTASVVDATHDAATSYNLRWSVSGAGSWTTLTGVTSGDVITGLTNGTAYDVEAAAANGSTTSPSAWSAIVTASTYSLAVAWGNLAPSTPVSHTGSWPSGGLNFVAGSTPPSGTVGYLAYATTAAPVPTSGFAGSAISDDTAGGGYGVEGFGQFLGPPGSAGTWYVFAILQNSSGTTIGCLVSSAITVT